MQTVLKTIYDAQKSRPKPQSYAQVWLEQIAEVVHRTPQTVRAWVYGYQQPDDLAKEKIADYLKMSVNELFPEDEN